MMRQADDLPALRSLILGIALAIIAFWIALPWEWGIMDDTEYVMNLSRIGFWDHLAQIAKTDRADGLFKYSHWLYASTIYLLPPWMGYGIRMLTFLATLGVALSLVSLRGDASLFILGVVLSVRGLHDGPVIIANQEGVGLFFSILGFFFVFKGRVSLAWIAFVAACGFKNPFVAAFASAGVFLWITEKKGAAVAFAASAALILGIGAYWSQTGNYTSNIYQFSLTKIAATLGHAIRHFAAPALAIGLAALFQLRERNRQGSSFQFFANSLLGAGLGYLLILLPRGVSFGVGYYLGPPVFLICLGIGLHLALRAPIPSFAATFALAIGLSVTAFGVHKGRSRMDTILGIRDFALGLPARGIRLAANSSEANIRMEHILKLRSSEVWNNSISTLTARDVTPADLPDYYFIFDEHDKPHQGAMLNLVRRLPLGAIYEKKP